MTGNSDDLLNKTIKRIRNEERFLVIQKIIIFSGTLAGSAICLVPCCKILFSEFSESGFFSFFSLIFSDFSIVISYWQNFLMALIEALPAITLALVLGLLLLLLQSARSLARNIKLYESF